MSGKFNHIDNRICLAYSVIVPLAVLFGGAVYLTNAGLDEIGVFFVFILLVISILPIIPLRKCGFSADDENVVFRVAFLKHTYRFSEIKSASTEVGFSHGRYGSKARVELVIALSDGDSVKFYDDDVPDDALSTPESHKSFRDTHQFTALCKFINERASG